MAIETRSWAEPDFPIVRAMVDHDSLARDFTFLRGDGELERLHTDPFLSRESRVLALQGGVPAGFGFAFLFGAAGGHRWALTFVGVPEPHRRSGVGSRLVSELEARIRAAAPWMPELCFAAWKPSPDAHAFAERHGYRPARLYWRMERAVDAALEPTWPPGVTTRRFDGSDAAIADWAAIYNDSFSEHYHFFISGEDDCRRIAASAKFRGDGLLLAYRDGRCVGFCRNQLHPDRGEVEILGVTRAARGIGLGRALLRWGVQWHSRQQAPRVTLMVDGENERALALYRDEAFTVERERTMFAKRLT